MKKTVAVMGCGALGSTIARAVAEELSEKYTHGLRYLYRLRRLCRCLQERFCHAFRDSILLSYIWRCYKALC